MNPRHALGAGALALALALGTAGVAYADEAPTDCGSATVAAVAAAQAAQASDQAVIDAQAALDAASLDGTVVAPGDVDRLDELKAKAADDTDPNHELAAEKVRLIEAYVAAQATLDTAKADAAKADQAAADAKAAVNEACTKPADDQPATDGDAPLVEPGSAAVGADAPPVTGQVAVVPDTTDGVDTGA